MSSQFSCEQLREMLAYNAETGMFTWIVRPARCIKVGDAAGSKTSQGYIQIQLFGRGYQAHRLAWLHFYGGWPGFEIDHIDGDKSNNALSNLRDVSKSVNQQNVRGPRSDNTHGFLGATRHGNGWRAQIRVDGKQRRIDGFSTPESAHAAYLAAKRQFHAGNTL